ncbi:MAG: DUF4349 domain-containing protein [Gemmatimonadetes bacterium]|nr:DUF4349 domain-containing protein [Gemmatimonadota bacterium]
MPTPTTRTLLLLSLLTAGCFGREADHARASEARMDAPASVGAGQPMDQSSAEFANAAPEPARVGSVVPNAAADPTAMPSMIIRTGQASLEVDSLELAMGRVQLLARSAGGFIANSQMQAGAAQQRAATLEIRVPSSRFDELLNGLAPIGKVEYVNVSAQDVGEEFTDITARVANARRLEQRLIELLATRTGKLSDVLDIERELARVREEVERMEGRLRYLKAHVATSSLTVTVHEPAPVVGETGSGGVIGEAFRDAWRNFVNFAAGLIASLGVVIPGAALVLAGLLAARWLWRRRHG